MCLRRGLVYVIFFCPLGCVHSGIDELGWAQWKVHRVAGAFDVRGLPQLL